MARYPRSSIHTTSRIRKNRYHHISCFIYEEKEISPIELFGVSRTIFRYYRIFIYLTSSSARLLIYTDTCPSAYSTLLCRMMKWKIYTRLISHMWDTRFECLWSREAGGLLRMIEKQACLHIRAYRQLLSGQCYSLLEEGI
jgi:hypothetical protein